jgi:DNA polymerase III sliding clamp (beta) subunit (PCNA family)
MATSFFRTAFQRVVAARERQASRYVNGVLMNLDDQTLHGMGTSREELRRKGGSTSAF